MSLLSITLVLFLIMDPLGNVSSYLSMTKELDRKKHRELSSGKC